MNSKRFSIFNTILMSSLVLLSMLATSALTPFASAVKPAKPATKDRLLQFTSGGHALGFTSQGMYAVSGSHALHVDFLNANNIQPQSDSAISESGKAAPLNRVTYAGLWDGITLTYTASPGSIYTTTYTLLPGADAQNIRQHYNLPLTLNKDGTLGMSFETGTLTESAPIAWQMIQGSQLPVDVSFRLQGQEVAFTLGKYDPQYALTIDPSLVWNTFLGGSGFDSGSGIALDANGNIYVAGSSDVTWGSPIRAFTGRDDAFAAKLDSSGNLLWNTFLGGSGDDYGDDIAVDGSGNVYISGNGTDAWSCISASCTVRAYTSGDYDTFAVKLDSSGNLEWNTFLGGSGDDEGGNITVDGSGNVFVAGLSTAAWGCSPASCTVRPYTGIYDDAFAAKLNSSGSLIWNTFLGGSEPDWGTDIAVDTSGNVYITGGGGPWGNPVRAYSGWSDAFIAKLDSFGNLIWNTFLGGSGWDAGYGITVDGSGNVYVTGESGANWDCSPASCTVRAYSLGRDAFVSKLNSSGALTWNTFLGGGGYDSGSSIAVDNRGNIYVAGASNATWGGPLRSYSGHYFDAIAARLNSSGSLLWNTFLGGNGYDDEAGGIASDNSGNTYVSGFSSSTWGSPVRAYSGVYHDAFVAKLDNSPAISGNLEVPGVILSYTDGTDKTVTSAADGGYGISVSSNWSGTITPSLACYFFSPVSRSYSNVVTDLPAQDFTPTYIPDCTDVNVSIGGTSRGDYSVLQGTSMRQSYAGVNDSPVQISSANSTNLIASQRVAYSPDGGTTWTSYSELMGLPATQLTTSYVMPWYNNADLNTQLRFANVGSSSTTVTVKVAGIVQGTYPLGPNQGMRVSYPGLNNGPVEVTSSDGVPIIASLRVAYNNGSAWTSYSELMGLPAPQLSTSYSMPWYNNVDLNTQLRFANVGASATNVTVTVGGVVQGTYPVDPGQGARVSYTGLNAGPVQITSSGNVPIIASERVAYFDGSNWTNFSEMMGLPSGQVTSSYVLPLYNNANLDTQLRFGNVGGSSTTVTVTIGGVVQGTYPLAPSQSARVSYTGLNTGPVQVQSTGGVPIIVSQRVAYNNGSAWTSFSEMMGLPTAQLATSYYMPWYNNADLNTQLRFAVP